MTTQELLAREIDAVAAHVEALARRRAEGEVSALYPAAREVAVAITYLRSDAPGYLQPDLRRLETQCASILRSIAH